MSNTRLFETVVTADSKELFIDLNQNDFGTFLKISEKSRNSRSAVVIPLSGIADVQNALQQAMQAASKAPARVVKTRPERVERSADEIARSVFVSRLAWETTDETLAAHFRTAGAVVNAKVNTRTRGDEVVSAGTALVEFRSATDAQRALELNETELDGRTISVKADKSFEDRAAEPRAPRARKERAPREAQAAREPREPRPPRARREPIDRTGAPVDPKRVYITSLSWDTTNEDLTNVFSAVGSVLNAEIIPRKDGRSSGTAVVEFADASDASEAIDRLNGRNLDGREMAVKVYYIK